MFSLPSLLRPLAHFVLVIGMGFTWLTGLVHAQPVPTPALERLADEAGRQGSVRVIVGLRLSTRPEGSLTATAVSQQRRQIASAQQALERQLAGTQFNAHGRFATIPFIAMEVDANALARLRASQLVQDIQEDQIATTNLRESVPLIGGTLAWGNGPTGAGWAVAVLDTGVDKTHPLLKHTNITQTDKVVSEACYSSNTTSTSSVCPSGVTSSVAPGSGVPCEGDGIMGCDHGTHVAGIAAGQNGVAKDADIVAIQVFSRIKSDNTLGSYSSDQIKGLERVLALATHQTTPLKIASANMSLGGGRYTSPCDSMAIKAAIDNLRSKGIATVIATGNNGYTNAISAPACVSTSVSVTASCDGSNFYCLGADAVAGYANVASFMSLAAPGSLITSAVPGTETASWHGTSMATPHVAGAWALIKQAHPATSVTDGLNWLRNQGVSINDTRGGGKVSGIKRISLGSLGLPTHTLAVSKSGSGTVTSDPPGISCGSACTASFTSGTPVTLTATLSGRSKSVTWGGGTCSGTSRACLITMDSAKSVTATFK